MLCTVDTGNWLSPIILFGCLGPGVEGAVWAVWPDGRLSLHVVDAGCKLSARLYHTSVV